MQYLLIFIYSANSLYKRVLHLEEEVFAEAFPNLCSVNPIRIKQTEKGSSHYKKDLAKIQEIDLDENIKLGDFVNKITL